MKIIVYPTSEKSFKNLARYLKERKFSFTSFKRAGVTPTKDPEEVEAINKYITATGKTRFRRTAQEISAGLSIAQAIELRLATPTHQE